MKYKSIVLLLLLLNSVSWIPLATTLARADYAWTETIYINADGSVQPASAPISSVDNVTYLLTDSIVGNIPGYSSAIRVERDNIAIDGNGYKLEGFGIAESTGIALVGRQYVTLRNLKVSSFFTGIWLSSSSHTTISGTTLIANTDHGCGIENYSNNNTLIGNNVTANTFCGVKFEDSCSNNTVYGNHIARNGEDGIQFFSSSNNFVFKNNITESGDDGIDLTYSNNNLVSENNIVNNTSWGIDRLISTGNIFYHNNFNNTHQVGGSPQTNVWDNGYPSGGNYWSDYTDADLYSGFYQNETGSDGIWDHGYVIDAYGVDSFPLVSPWSEHTMTVPFHYQTVDYYCGPACLEMVFDYYGEDISQLEIAEVARTHPYTTYIDELRRAAHFSNISESKGTEMPENITGYVSRRSGYAAFEQWSVTIDQLKSLIDNDLPIILLMWYSPSHVSGHYRVAVGYNNTHIILHDPWNNVEWGGLYGGPYLAFNYSTFLDLWSYSGYWALFTSPWKVKINAPQSVQPGSNFTVVADITYPCPPSFPASDYPSLQCSATIVLPTGLVLVQGETSKKTLDDILPGNSAKSNWTVEAETCGLYNLSIEAEGTIDGSVSANDDFPSYSYEDRIGAKSDSSLEVAGYDLTIREITLSKNLVGQGYNIFMNVTVENEGSLIATSSLIVYAKMGIDERMVANISDIVLPPEGSVIVLLTWNTSLFPKGTYVISAYIVPVQGEIDIDDNLYLDGQVTVVKPGDLNADGFVDIFDIVIVATAFGSMPGDPNWNVIADINGDDTIDIFDLVVVAVHFGETS